MPLLRNYAPVLRDYLEWRVAGREGESVERVFRLWDDLPTDLMMEGMLLQTLAEQMPTDPRTEEAAEGFAQVDQLRDYLVAAHVWMARYREEVLRIFMLIVRHSYPEERYPELTDEVLADLCDHKERMEIINHFFSRRSPSSSAPSSMPPARSIPSTTPTSKPRQRRRQRETN